MNHMTMMMYDDTYCGYAAGETKKPREQKEIDQQMPSQQSEILDPHFGRFKQVGCTASDMVGWLSSAKR